MKTHFRRTPEYGFRKPLLPLVKETNRYGTLARDLRSVVNFLHKTAINLRN